MCRCCSDYTPIKTLEQRRKYKEDFNSNYAEYRKLHTIVAKVACKFAQYEQRLNKEEKNSEAYKVLYAPSNKNHYQSLTINKYLR